ncbi:MAG: hypothetical protein KBT20_03280 [Bacteroidales bacterium]|nr:hypothetical protein [Candidatus Liminaster caballi]
MNTSDITPLLQEMLTEMQSVLSTDDIKAGLPENVMTDGVDASTLYVEWQELKHKLEKQKHLIRELDNDILGMEPWGDFPMSRIDQLSKQGQSLRFWKVRDSEFDGNRQQWIDNYQAELVSSNGGYSYFVTVTPIETVIVLTGAEEMSVTPSPVSTLLSLQTHAKDSLHRIIVQQGDFALSHYRAIEEALGLHDTLKMPTKRHRFKRMLKRIIRSK